MNTQTFLPEIEPTIRLLSELFPNAGHGRVAFRLWDGTVWPDQLARAATIVLRSPLAVREIYAAGTERGLAEAFVENHFDVEGDLEAACELADDLAAKTPGNWLTRATFAFRLHRHAAGLAPRRMRTQATRKHSKARDRQAISHHYDLSNEFYRLWLDSKMLYSCAYFEQPDNDLETAQSQKLHHIYRKLRLQPGMRLLDIGCGWGGLAVTAAQQYDVRVTGVTLSQQQASLAESWISHARLAEKVAIELKDYRDLDAPESFDAIVSVGMAEHVGAENLKTYFAKAFSLLKPGGVFLNHAIGDGVRARATRGGSFIQDYVFPDSELPRIPTVVAAAESAGFEVRDVENLREHYTLTLRHWLRRLEGAENAAAELVGQPTFRLWRLYLAASAHGFASGRLALYQTLLSKPDNKGRSHLPLTRRDWYEAK